MSKRSPFAIMRMSELPLLTQYGVSKINCSQKPAKHPGVDPMQWFTRQEPALEVGTTISVP